MYALVLIEYNTSSLDKTFTYHIPNELLGILKVGMKVVVPFNNRNINGFVLNISDNFSLEYEIKDLISIKDPELILNDELIDLGKYLKKITMCNLINAYQTMLPTSLKVKTQKQNFKLYDTYIELSLSKKKIINIIENNQRSKVQVAILNKLLKTNKILKKEIASSALKTLLDKNIVKEIKEEKYRINKEKINGNNLLLSNDQKTAIEAVDLNVYKTYLIHGVTGSGKTEVYLRLIKLVIENKKTAIMLVPEISLTVQTVKKFYETFGSRVAIFHSKLSDGEKYDEYLKILRGEVDIVVGTRSAIFAPLKNIGIIIIDEEHSDTYKQENNPRYNAITIAKYRANKNNIPLILASATPSIESYARALKGTYKLINMPRRINNQILPVVNIVDMTEEIKNKNNLFSEILLNKINEKLSKKEQVILFLNRRGYSTTINCQNCGYVYKCPHCDISLTYHKSSNNLRCHYCGWTTKKLEICPSCHEKSLRDLGTGTEKIEIELTNIFKNYRILRMDADTTTKKDSHETKIIAFKNHEYDILLGTQMISKGLDFPNVTLVGILNADSALNMPDFRSGERTFSLLEQVSGRAGRGSLSGEVLIQTFNKDNYIFECLKNNSYLNYFKYEFDIRKKLNYPPFTNLISIKVVGYDYDKLSKEVNLIASYLKSNISDTSIILGPTTANVFKMKNKYRFQIIIKYTKDEKMYKALFELNKKYLLNKDINIEIDLEPINI